MHVLMQNIKCECYIIPSNVSYFKRLIRSACLAHTRNLESKYFTDYFCAAVAFCMGNINIARLPIHFEIQGRSDASSRRLEQIERNGRTGDRCLQDNAGSLRTMKTRLLGRIPYRK